MVLAGTGPEAHTIDGKTLLIVHIPPNAGTLYQATGVFWMRRGSYTTPMNMQEISGHLHATGMLHWEMDVCPHATLDDLDLTLVERYVNLRNDQSQHKLRHTSQEELLAGLKCVARDPQTAVLRPPRVGMLLFGRNPQFHIPQSEIVCVRYEDALGAGKYQDRKVLNGTLTEMIDQAADFVRRACQRRCIIGSPSLPVKANYEQAGYNRRLIIVRLKL